MGHPPQDIYERRRRQERQQHAKRQFLWRQYDPTRQIDKNQCDRPEDGRLWDQDTVAGADQQARHMGQDQPHKTNDPRDRNGHPGQRDCDKEHQQSHAPDIDAQ